MPGCTDPAPDDTAGHDPVETAPDHTATDTGEVPHSETGSETGETDTDEPGDALRGTRLDPPLAPPAFEVLNQDGDTRTPDWLVGHPTVLWFFRDASGST